VTSTTTNGDEKSSSASFAVVGGVVGFVVVLGLFLLGLVWCKRGAGGEVNGSGDSVVNAMSRNGTESPLSEPRTAAPKSEGAGRGAAQGDGGDAWQGHVGLSAEDFAARRETEYANAVENAQAIVEQDLVAYRNG
jgi:hypothetical protein